MNTQQNQNSVPTHVRQFYRDESHPVKIFNQHPGNEFHSHDYNSAFPNGYQYRNQYQGYGRRETGMAELRIDYDRFFVLVDLKYFAPEEISVRTTIEGYLYIEAHHQEREDEYGYATRRFVRKYHIPDGVDFEQLNAYFTSDGAIIVSGPKQPSFEQQQQQQVRADRRISITQTGQPSTNLQQQQYSKKK